MNIQCQQCGASYAVADDKVRGRLMKVRCKSCSEPIRVDGTLLDNTPARPSLASSPPSARVDRSETEGATWHIAVGDSTQGPYTLDELRDHYRSGAVLLDTLVYCEGAEGDWRPAGEVPELTISAPKSHAPAPSQVGAAAFGSAVSMGSDPFGDQRRAPSHSPRVSASGMLENAPTEHTVQFSLDQIRALSSVSAAPQMPTSAAPINVSSRASVYPSAGYAGGDGSGLIDVRKLAELHQAMAEQDAAPPMMSEPLLPSSGSYAHTLAPLSLPLAPVSQSVGIDSKTKIVAGLAAFGMVLAAAVGVLALTRPQVQATAALPPQDLTGTGSVAATAQPPAPDTEKAAPEAAQPAAADENAAADEPEEQQGSETASAPSSRSKRSGGKRSGSAKRDRASSNDDLDLGAKAEKPSKSSAKSDIDDLLGGAPSKTAPKSSAGASIDDLLDNAVSGKKSAPKAEEKVASDLPQTPGRDQMLSALNKAKAKASKCKGTGVATAQIQIAGSSGRATSVNVSGVDGPAGSCVEKAVKSTSFPKFQKDSFEVKFPFKLGS